MSFKQLRNSKNSLLGIWNYSGLNLGSDKVITEEESSGREGKNFEKTIDQLRNLWNVCTIQREQLRNFGV